jgi:hypothetical protein
MTPRIVAAAVAVGVVVAGCGDGSSLSVARKGGMGAAAPAQPSPSVRCGAPPVYGPVVRPVGASMVRLPGVPVLTGWVSAGSLADGIASPPGLASPSLRPRQAARLPCFPSRASADRPPVAGYRRTYNDPQYRPHGLAVRTPAFHAGDRRFESGWGYSRIARRCWGSGLWGSLADVEMWGDGSVLEALVRAIVAPGRFRGAHAGELWSPFNLVSHGPLELEIEDLAFGDGLGCPSSNVKYPRPRPPAR